MTKAQMDAFLMQPRIGRVATVRPDGRPHVVPIWYEWDGSVLRWDTPPTFQKGKNLLNDPRLAAVVDITLGGLRYAGVMLEGTARLDLDPTQAAETAERIYRQYLGAEGVLSPTPQAMIHESAHMIVELEPDHIVTWDFTESLAPLPEDFE